jgi:malate dehydrogenase (oxaloacetate-decarboxylating)(NADP+)
MDPVVRTRWFQERRDRETNERWREVSARGAALIDHPMLNKSTAFSEEERDTFGLRGLLPPKVTTIERQMERVLTNFNRKESPLERYIHLISLMDRNETLFYRTVLDNIERMLPIIYTPTVGEACQQFGRIYRRSRGLYITPEDTHRIDEILANWPYEDVAVVVVTDGERILGLGDLGAGGMGISIGKCSLYVTGAGIHPARMMPVCLDVGTDNDSLMNDPLYLGKPRRRVRGAEYDALVDAFVAAVSRRFPQAIIQFEDFGKLNAFRLLERHRSRSRCFNDDIQGTGAVTLAGVLAALRISGEKLEKQRVFIVGGGSAGVGIGSMLAGAEIWMFDSKGLVTADRAARSELGPYARKEPPGDLHAVADRVHPTVLIGVSGKRGMFDERLIRSMGGPRPIVFPLSNPTANSECTPEEARTWTSGRAIVASGSPFPDTAQCNNMYIFPGLGLGVLAARAERIDEDLFRIAARALADLAPADKLYPALNEIRRISRSIALAVACAARDRKLGPEATDAELAARIDDQIWEPKYLPYRPASTNS